MSDTRAERHENAVIDSKVILVVDDEPDILELMGIYLEECLPSVRMIGASNGREALDLLRTADVDLIISDFRMPQMDGVEFLSNARDLLPQVPRVLYTAYDDPALERRAREEAGVEAIYSKDLSATELTNKIRGLLLDHPVQPTQRT